MHFAIGERRAIIGPCSKAREQDYRTVVQPCIWFKNDPSPGPVDDDMYVMSKRPNVDIFWARRERGELREHATKAREIHATTCQTF